MQTTHKYNICTDNLYLNKNKIKLNHDLAHTYMIKNFLVFCNRFLSLGNHIYTFVFESDKK